MIKYYVAVFCAIAFVLAWMYIGLGDKNPYTEIVEARRAPHAYDDAQTPIGDILITVYYFVPANKSADAQDTSWKEPMTRALERLQQFHALHFGDRSRIRFALYPTPIIGREDNMYYDSLVTQHGNPNALQTITQEISQIDPPTSETGIYPVTYIMYDGVGASGMRLDSVHAALLNRNYLINTEYAHYRDALVAHEFYHTLGIPDGYDLSTGTSTTADLMGLGRTQRPLQSNYLAQETLSHMGI